MEKIIDSIKRLFPELSYVLAIFILCAVPYLIVILPAESFFESVSIRDTMQNYAHVILHSLFFPTLFVLLVYKQKKYILPVLLSCIFALILISNSMYYEYFRSFIYLEQVSSITVLPSIGGHIVKQLVSWKEILIFTSFAGAIFLGSQLRLRILDNQDRGAKKGRSFLVIFLILILCLLVSKPFLMSARHSPFGIRSRDTTQLVKQFGLVGFYATELINASKPSPPLPIFPGGINPNSGPSNLKSNFAGHNVIFLQVESLDAKALDFKVGDDFLMENLNRLKDESIYFPHFFAQHRGGASQDAELSTLFSVLPVNGRSGFNSIRINEARSLAQNLKEAGYTQTGFHANSGAFFNREKLFLKTGFNKFKDANDYHGEATGWESKDEAFYSQTIEMLQKLPEPYFAYLITMQSHGPFENLTETSSQLELQEYTTLQQNYLRSMYEVDLAIGKFLSKLETSGALDNTIVFIYADHSSNVDYPNRFYEYNSMSPHEHIPLFILTPSKEASRRNIVGSHLDLAPTLLDLLGRENDNTWLGNSLFVESDTRTILNYPNPIIIENDGDGIRFGQFSIDLRDYIEWSEALQSN